MQQRRESIETRQKAINTVFQISPQEPEAMKWKVTEVQK